MVTFSLVEKLNNVRVILSLPISNHPKLVQLDISNAFLNGVLFEEIYLDMSLRYQSEGENMEYKLNKFLYMVYGKHQDNDTIHFPPPLFNMASINHQLITPCSPKVLTLVLLPC